MPTFWAAGAAIISLAATPAPATATASSATVTVRVVGDDIDLPLPAGYCEPTGRYIDLAQIIAAVDKESITLATFYDCAAMAAEEVPKRYIIVKALRAALMQRITREELLKQLGDIPKSEMTAAIQAATTSEALSKNASEVLGDVDLGAKMEPADADENGYYMAGVGRFKKDATSYTLAMAVGITSVKGHVLSLSAYQPGETMKTIAETLRQARFETSRMVKANQP